MLLEVLVSRTYLAHCSHYCYLANWIVANLMYWIQSDPFFVTGSEMSGSKFEKIIVENKNIKMRNWKWDESKKLNFT